MEEKWRRDSSKACCRGAVHAPRLEEEEDEVEEEVWASSTGHRNRRESTGY